MGGLGSFSSQRSCVSQVAGGPPDQRQLSHPCASPISGWNQDSSANLGRKKVTQHKHKSAGRAQADFTFPLVFPSRWESLETLSWLPGVMHGSEFSSFKTTVLNFSSLSVVFSVVHNLLPHLAPQHCHPCVLLRLGSPCTSASGQWMWQTQVLAAGVRCPWRGGLSAGAAIVTACCFGPCERNICLSLPAALIRNTELSFAYQHHPLVHPSDIKVAGHTIRCSQNASYWVCTFDLVKLFSFCPYHWCSNAPASVTLGTES